MNVSIIAFTANGAKTTGKIIGALSSDGHLCKGYVKGSFPTEGDLAKVTGSLSDWTGEVFKRDDALVFVGAAAIAVRSIAPYIKSKTEDPAVITVDEQGVFVIPLLSGHIGGANGLARSIAERLSATAVVTTATDLNGKLAVDQWAKEHNLHISDMKTAKQIAANLLQNKKVGFFSDFPIRGTIPEELSLDRQERNIAVTIKNTETEDGTLLLTPKAVVLGIGCRRGTAESAIAEFVNSVLNEAGISWQAVKRVASIDLKKDEQGLIEFCRRRGLAFQVYSAAELAEVKGDFTKSDFVASVTGVDNVCERAAVSGSFGGQLIMKKQAGGGVTAAAALENIELCFDENIETDRS